MALGILVDGHPVPLNGAVDHLPGGGELYYDPVGDVVVRWPDGSKAVVYAAGIGGYVVFTAAGDLTGQLKGLLTAVAEPEGAPGIPAGDEVLIGGNGTRYVVNTYATSPSRALYEQFGPSWQVTPQESLFTYPRGKSTSSYILKNFPGRSYALTSVPSGRLTDIQSTCRRAGVTNAALLQDCVYDSAATGRPPAVVAALAARTETVVTAAEQGATSSPSGPTTVPLGTGSSLPVTAADPATGTTYVAWAPNSGNSIDLCVVVASGPCNGTGRPDQLTDPAIGASGPPQYSDPRLLLMPGTGQVVVVAAVWAWPPLSSLSRPARLHRHGRGRRLGLGSRRRRLRPTRGRHTGRRQVPGRQRAPRSRCRGSEPDRHRGVRKRHLPKCVLRLHPQRPGARYPGWPRPDGRVRPER